jgi:hypothetical protein
MLNNQLPKLFRLLKLSKLFKLFSNQLPKLFRPLKLLKLSKPSSNQSYKPLLKVHHNLNSSKPRFNNSQTNWEKADLNTFQKKKSGLNMRPSSHLNMFQKKLNSPTTTLLNTLLNITQELTKTLLSIITQLKDSNKEPNTNKLSKN